MEFESPDVEKDFPGLYASESGKKSNESDFSDVEGKDKHSKKEILIGKRSKDKKESKKDRGYAALEGESSPEEEITDAELKSPSKSKKTKSFKFPSKKDKQRDKHKDKENKEKEPKELKEKDGKVKAKLKEKKKSKHVVEETVDLSEQAPVFGVSLSTAVERSGCHDGVQLPLVVRDCIDYLEEHGLKVEGIHRSLGMRAKVQQLRKMYNQREEVSLSGHETSVVTSLLKQFFRELPEPVVSKTVEEAATAVGGSSSGGQNLAELTALVQQLPTPNRTILAWILTHMEHIVEQEKHNRMGLQNVSLVVGPMLMVGQRALAALFNHRRTLFGEVTLKKYKPPLSAGGPCPDTAEGIEEELAKQESLLGQIHREMNAGIVSKKREEQLWEVQRFVTNLKRKLRLLQRTHGSMHKSQEEEDSGTERVAEGHRLVKGSSEEGDDFKMNLNLQNTQQSIDEDVEESERKEEESCDKGAEEPNVALKTSDASRGELEKSEVGDGLGKEEVETIKPSEKPDGDEVDSKIVVEELKKANDVVKETLAKENESVSKDVPEMIEEESPPEKIKLPVADGINTAQESKAARMAAINALSKFTQEELEKAAAENEQIMYLKLEHEELLKFKDELQGRIKAEKLQAKKLMNSIHSKRSKPNLGGPPSHPPPQLSEASEQKKETANKNEDVKLEDMFDQLKNENETLEQKASTLTRLIFEEREACIRTKVQLSILQMRQSQSAQMGV